MAQLKGVYFDNSVFVDVVKTDLGKVVAADRLADVWMAKRLMEAHRDKEIQVLTSALTIAECTHCGDGDVSDRAQFLISKMLTSGDYVHLIQMTPFVAIGARDLRWKHGINLKGADGIHAASALSEGCNEFLTGDGRFDRLHVHHAAFESLGMKVSRASGAVSLPTRYRQIGFGGDLG
jgi:predicted nucleic acid-binding protein